MFRIVLLMIVISSASLEVPAQASTNYINGLWWQNGSFKSQTWYEEDGLLTQQPSNDVTQTIDLANQYIIPPYGEAHHHSLQEVFLAQQFSNQYIQNGIFYSMMMCANAKGQEAAREFLDTTPLSVAFASACVSTSDGHPLRMALRPHFEGAPIPEPETIYDSMYIVMDSASDIKDKWYLIEAGKPDIVKIILVHHELEERRGNDKYFGVNGLNSEVATQLVKKIHENGMRVAAHVDSAADFELVVNAGVDIVAHIPGYHWWDGYDQELYRLTDAAVNKAAEQGVKVITTASVTEFLNNSDNERFDKIVEMQIENIEKLLEAGVSLVFGSDRFDGDIIDEVKYFEELEILSTEKILRILVSDTPRAIFPHRSIGRFDEGFEASFLALQNNPLFDINALRNITLAVKQGNHIEGFDRNTE